MKFIYIFQKSKHGGEEVDDIWMVRDGEAIIVFENPEGSLKCKIYWYI